MNEEIAMRTLAYLITHYKQHDETIINSEEIQAIEFLQQENQKLKEDYNKVVHESTAFESKVYELEEDIKGLQQERNNLINSIPFKENKHYKHIIDELEKWLEEEIKSWKEAINEEHDYELVNEFSLRIDIFQDVLNKLQELKGSE